jgi:multidrug efflux system membrane fusion protein
MTVSGVVSDVYVRPGQHVTQGQALVALDSRELAARVEHARARRDRILPELEEARREFERAEDLYVRTLLSEHELELAKIALAKLEAAGRGTAARLARAEIQLEHATLRAPFAGVIVQRTVENGQSVVSHCESVPLLVLAENDRLVARAQVRAEQLMELRVGQAIAVTTGAQSLKGTVLAMSAEPVDPDAPEPRYAVDVLFQVPGGKRLLVGQPAVLELP